MTLRETKVGISRTTLSACFLADFMWLSIALWYFFWRVRGQVRVPRGAHLYIKGWLPSIYDVAVTANEMREGLSVGYDERSICTKHRV